MYAIEDTVARGYMAIFSGNGRKDLFVQIPTTRFLRLARVSLLVSVEQITAYTDGN
jgi:hypothetical protein